MRVHTQGETHAEDDAREQRYGYDCAGRLASLLTPDTSLLLSYDALGNRVRTSANGTDRLWEVDHSDPLKRPLAETATNGAPVRYYVWGAGRLLGVADASGALLCAHCDDMGSVAALTDAAGAVVFTAAYGPYGEDWGSAGTNAAPFGWLGSHGVLSAAYLCPPISGLRSLPDPLPRV